MEDDQKRVNCSFIGFSSDEYSDTSPSKSSIKRTPPKRSGDLTLIGFSSDNSLDSFLSPAKSGKTITCDYCPSDDGLEHEQERPVNVTLLGDSDHDEMEETVYVSDSDSSRVGLDEEEQRDTGDETTTETNTAFKGKRIFIDGRISNKDSNGLVSLIKQRGALVETFLSKWIDLIVISDSIETKSKGVFSEQNTVKLSFRGARMYSEAMKKLKADPLHLKQFARKWKIPVCKASKFGAACSRVEKISSAFYCKGNTNWQLKKLQPHFIKVEDQSRKYCPEFAEFEEFPFTDFNSPSGSCPFKFKLKKSSACWVRKRQALGFCECCQIHYSDLDKHLKGT